MPATKIAPPLRPSPSPRSGARRSISSRGATDWYFSGEVWICTNHRDPGDRGRFVRVSGIVRAECERSARVLASRMAREQVGSIGEVYSVRIDDVE
jgi:hypothetical protein